MNGSKLRRGPALGAGLALVALMSMSGSVPAHAAVPVTTVGWWTRSPSPPAVPDGGIAVGEAPDGNLSIAAIKLGTAGGASGAKLTLAESSGEAQQAASLQVCTTTDTWNADNGTSLTLAPRPSCPNTPVLMTRDASGSWTADLSPLLAGLTGDVSIMILPGPTPAAVPGVGQAGAFQISFTPPTVDGSVAPEDTSGSSFDSGSSYQAAPAYTAPDYSVSNSPAFSPVGNTPSAVLPPSPPQAAVSSQNAGGGKVSFPVGNVGAGKKATSRLVLLSWVLLSILVGAAAAGVRWGQEQGIFDRLIPSGGGSLLPPEID